MAKDTQPTPAAGDAENKTPPSLNIVGQYIRDLSFENPSAPQSILAASGNPGFNVAINVQVKKQSDDIYAVELTMNAKAERDGSILFNAELVYGGANKNMANNKRPNVVSLPCDLYVAQNNALFMRR